MKNTEPKRSNHACQSHLGSHICTAETTASIGVLVDSITSHHVGKQQPLQNGRKLLLLKYSLLVLREVPERNKAEPLGPAALKVAYKAGARAEQEIDTVVKTLKWTFNSRRQTPLDPKAFFWRRQKPSEDPAVYPHELHQTAREAFVHLSQVYLDKMVVRQFSHGL